ncbi:MULTISPECIES: endonuclease [unclassified Yoonia]|uniref:endonuclease n=1 Tax=unclassified Yoonia TaxID=2629118 RepID=UPI002AFF86D3|nr:MULTISPECIES: endonuclease [unclassified Yoonia]
MWKKLAKGVVGLIFVLVAIVGCQQVRNSGSDPVPEAAPQVLRLATYNVHYIILGRQTGPWSVGDWERRKGPLDLAFKAVNADIMAFQEMESFGGGSDGSVNLTLDWLLANNPLYAAAALGPVEEFPSTQPILYRRDRLTLLHQGWFFFSDTPDVIYSRTFNGSYPAFASWAQFRDLTSGAVFRVVNLHTDYASLSNREQSIALVADRITPWVQADEALFVTGDFNARLGSPILEMLGDLGVDYVPVQGSTFHFNRGFNLFGAIDHIGSVGGPVLAAGPFVLREKFDGEWPTDHYPLAADFTLPAP